MKTAGEKGCGESRCDGHAGRNLPIEQAIESFYLETKDGLFFAVKGMEHPPDRRIAVLRYAPDAANGSRRKEGTRYRRLYHFDEQEQFLRASFRQYLAYDPYFQTTLQSVPISSVRTVYDPRRRFQEMAEVSGRAEIEEDAFAFLSLLQIEAQVPSSALGITGSLLTGLATANSDLDAVVFGTDHCDKVCAALRRMLESPRGGDLRRMDAAGMEELFAQRAADTRMDYGEFLELENRKVNQGLFRQRPYFIRFVKDACEAVAIYGRQRYIPWGRATITGIIANEREAIFTPCRYPLLDVRVLEGLAVSDLSEIVSFRGRFCEQAQAGEMVRASGTLERIEEIHGGVRHRLLLGNFAEDGMSVVVPRQN